MKYFSFDVLLVLLMALVSLLLAACGTGPDTAVSTSTGAGAAGGEGGGMASSTAEGTGGGRNVANAEACPDDPAAGCPPGSDCEAFKICIEDDQTDPDIAACENANPDGAAAWAAVVHCLCLDPSTPSWFCADDCDADPLGCKYGHSQF